MKKLIFILSLFLFVPVLSFGGEVSGKISPKTVISLKQYMSRFGTTVASIELMREQNKKPDWDIVNESLDTMKKTIQEMKQVDAQNQYIEFTSVLDQQFLALEAAAKKKNKQFYKLFDDMLETCFTCHKTHRSPDFLTQPQ